jgi:V/A-type H+-transporting ATPase subunit E
MTDKIQEITQKIYNEGILKAKDDADKIIAEAKTKAEEIIQSAKKEQVEIINRAQQKADEIKSKTDIEMQLAARKFISKLKQSITKLVTTAQVNNPIKSAFNDSDFVKKMILQIIGNWDSRGSEEINLKLLLPEKDEKEFSAFFAQKASETLDKGIEVKFDPKAENGFKIGPKDGGYLISFSDKDFENLFKAYIKDRTKELLFDSINKE